MRYKDWKNVNGHPNKSIKGVAEEKSAGKILKELGIGNNAVDFLKVLEDAERLDIAIRKLKLKAFW